MELRSTSIDEDFKTSAKRFKDQGADSGEIDIYIRDFKSMKPKIQDVDKKDIDKWKTWDEFKAYVDELKQTKSKGQEKKEKKKLGAQLVASDKYWDVYKITTHDAAMLYGSGTKWCITEPGGQHWDSYSSDSDFYFYISKRLRPSSPFYKIALQVDSSGTLTYWDATDRSHGESERSFWNKGKLGAIPFKLPDVPGVDQEVERRKYAEQDAEPMHSIYLKPGSVFTSDMISNLEQEFGEDMVTNVPFEGEPTTHGTYLNVASNDEEVVKKVVAIIGQDKVQEIAPELTS